jgi:hypothetical protein
MSDFQVRRLVVPSLQLKHILTNPALSSQEGVAYTSETKKPVPEGPNK